jgi:hypothetical protein
MSLKKEKDGTFSHQSPSREEHYANIIKWIESFDSYFLIGAGFRPGQIQPVTFALNIPEETMRAIDEQTVPTVVDFMIRTQPVRPGGREQ